MPEGVTAALTRGELLDLVKFVSELGKAGPYAIRTARTVQRWKHLRELPAALKEGVPNRDVLRDAVLRAGPEAWETVYALHEGTLPLAELHKGGGEKAVYLQGEVQVAQAGPVEVVVGSGAPVTFWVDEEPFEKQGRATVPLTPGRHLITVRVPAGVGGTDGLRLELRRPADSRARFEIVQGE
jgi:hypothetical protein